MDSGGAGPMAAGDQRAPRVLVVSQRQLWDAPWFSYVAEYERTLAELLDATVVEITARDSQIATMLRHRYRLRTVLASLPLTQTFAMPRPAERFDLGIVVVNDLQQLGILSSLPGWRKMADRFIAFVVELWPAWVQAARPAVEDVVSKMTAVYATIERTVPDLRQLSGTDVHFLPPGVDTLFSRPPVTSLKRYVHVSNRGRRSPTQHDTILAWADASDHVYEFDTGNLTAVDSHALHRRHYYDQCGLSRFYVTNYARFDQPQLRDGAEELGLRYFEGLASGCVLVGQHPSDGRVRDLLGDAHVLDMPLDAGAMPDDVVAAVDDDDWCSAACRHNRGLALERHDVLHRWDVVRSHLQLPAGESVERRRERLAAARSSLAG